MYTEPRLTTLSLQFEILLGNTDREVQQLLATLAN